MKAHTNSFKEQIKLIGKEIDSRITFGDTVLGKDDLNAVTPSYQGAILKSVMKQLDIDSNVAIPIGTILRYEFGLKVNGEYEYINYGNYVVYSVEKQEDTNSYKIVCYDKLLYSMLDYVKLPITYPISIRDYINAVSTALGLTFANRSGIFANYDKQIQADLYDGLGYTFRDVLDELAQVTASTICLNNNDELEIRYITETGDTIDEEFLKDVNVNFGEKFGAVNTIVLSRSGDSDSVYHPPVLPANPYEIKISDNQIMNGNDRADFLPDIYNKLNGLEFYTNDFVSTGICYYDLCDRYSVRIGDNTYSCVMFNNEILVTQGLEENVYTELPEQTETDYKHASKDDRMINQVYIIAKKNEAEILAVVNTTEQIQKEINPPENASDSEIIVEDASNNPLLYLEVEGKSTQETRSGKNKLLHDYYDGTSKTINGITYTVNDDGSVTANGTATANASFNLTSSEFDIPAGTYKLVGENENYSSVAIRGAYKASNGTTKYLGSNSGSFVIDEASYGFNFYIVILSGVSVENITFYPMLLLEDETDLTFERGGISPSPDYPSEIESVGIYNEETGKYGIEVETTGKNLWDNSKVTNGSIITNNGTGFKISRYESMSNITGSYEINLKANTTYYISFKRKSYTTTNGIVFCRWKKSDGTFLWAPNLEVNQAFTPTDDIIAVNFYLQSTEADGSYVEIENLQIEEGSEATKFEPYQKNTSLIVLNAPLRSLPNGVKDIAYIKNNRLYVDHYVGSVVLDGSDDEPLKCQEIISDYNKVVMRYTTALNISETLKNDNLLSNYFTADTSVYNRNDKTGFYVNANGLINFVINLDTIDATVDSTTTECLSLFKTWLSTNNVQVDYELAEPYTEEIGEIETLKTLLGYNKITTTDDLKPTLNITYVRDTVLADYVENHIAELKINEEQISQRVETIDTSVDGLQTDISRVEQITTDTSQVLNIISTNIDKSTGEVREVTTTTGFTFNKDGMTIDDGSGFKAEHRADGTYYKDGTSTVGQYTKDGSKQKDLELFGTYSYGKTDIDDTPMFVGQLYTDENGDEGFGHFYNGGDY